MGDRIRTLTCLLVSMSILLFFMACEELSQEPVAEQSSETIQEVKQTYLEIPLSHEVQDYLKECCEARDIPVELALAFIDVESDFRQEIISNTDDYGLMQINICNHDYITKQLGVTDYLSPMENINAGTYWLSRYYPRYGIEQAAMCYHLGEGRAKELFKKGIYSTNYSREILKEYERYAKCR